MARRNRPLVAHLRRTAEILSSSFGSPWNVQGSGRFRPSGCSWRVKKAPLGKVCPCWLAQTTLFEAQNESGNRRQCKTEKRETGKRGSIPGRRNLVGGHSRNCGGRHRPPCRGAARREWPVVERSVTPGIKSMPPMPRSGITIARGASVAPLRGSCWFLVACHRGLRPRLFNWRRSAALSEDSAYCHPFFPATGRQYNCRPNGHFSFFPSFPFSLPYTRADLCRPGNLLCSKDLRQEMAVVHRSLPTGYSQELPESP